MRQLLFFVGLSFVLASAQAGDALKVWPDLAPGETTRQTGELQPFRPQEKPPVNRVINITQPTFTVHLAKRPNGSGVVILPGGGFGKVVTNKEGAEAAAWLNQHGFAAFVLSYRTKIDRADPGWKRPLQDSQRMMSLVRRRADEWKLRKDRIGLLGFSAGGQVAARLLSSSERAYARVDETDDEPCRPDFALLVYPWNIYDVKSAGLIEGVNVPKNCPPTFIVHTDDDRSSSLGAVLFYMGLKQQKIPAELHVYGNGGHGYGLRPIAGSEIATWPGHAAHWLGRLVNGKK